MKESVCMGGRAMRLMSGRGVGECGSGRHSYGGGVISEGRLAFERGALKMSTLNLRVFC